MNGAEASEKWIEMHGDAITVKLKKAVERITRKIEKALNKGRSSIRLGIFFPLFWGFLDNDLQKIVENYLTYLGFDVFDHAGGYEVSWKPTDLGTQFKIVEDNARLRHVIETGHAPRVTL